MLRKTLLVITAAFLLNSILICKCYLDEPEQRSDQMTTTKLLTPDDLKKETKLYLAILGEVYDVSKGGKHYQRGGRYEFFVGKDASRAYVTGDFKNDLNDRIDDLSEAQVADLFNKWKKFYEKTYTHVGHVVGAFYDANGAKTEQLLKAEKSLEAQKSFNSDL